MIVPRAEEHHGLWLRGFDQLARIGADESPPTEQPEIDRLEVHEARIRPLDGQHRLPVVEEIAFNERVYGEGRPVIGAQLEDGDRFVDSAEITSGLARNL